MSTTKVLGIENLKKAAKFGIDLGEQFASVMEDGKFKGMEILQFIDEMMQLPGVINSGADIKAEINELTHEERVELNEYIAGEFDIPNDILEKKIEYGLDILVSVFKFIDTFKK